MEKFKIKVETVTSSEKEVPLPFYFKKHCEYLPAYTFVFADENKVKFISISKSTGGTPMYIFSTGTYTGVEAGFIESQKDEFMQVYLEFIDFIADQGEKLFPGNSQFIYNRSKS